MQATITFPKSRIDEFEKTYWLQVKGKMRYGQAFFHFMDLGKVKNKADAALCDKIYYVSEDEAAKKFIADHTDYEN